MTQRWQHELEKWGRVEVPAGLAARLEAGPRGEGMPPSPRRWQGLVAGTVALAVSFGALWLIAGAFRSGPAPVDAPLISPLVTLVAGEEAPEASLTLDGRSAGVTVDSYCWNQANGAGICVDFVAPPPFLDAAFLVVPAGVPFELENPDGADLSWSIAEGDDPTLRGRDLGPDELSSIAPGRYVLTVAADWQGRGETITFHFALEVASPSSPPSPTPEPTAQPGTVVAPDLIGLRDQEALRVLYDLGLRWDVWFHEAEDRPRWTVFAQDPPAGTALEPESVVRLKIATLITTIPDRFLALDCEGGVWFGGPHARIQPAGEAYVRGNTGGIRRDDVVEPIEDQIPGDEGYWRVVRDGRVIAVIAYPGLDGFGCAGEGVGGVP